MDAIDRQNKFNFIRDQLARYAGQKKEAGNRMMILCPYHSERTPSGSIWLGERGLGRFKCFACPARATWDEVAPRLGLQPYKKGPPKDEEAMDLLMSKGLSLLTVQEKYRKDKFKFSKLPRNKFWRQIPTNLLIELGARFCYRWFEEYQKWGTEKFIHFPVVVKGDTEGFFLARLKKKKDKPSYLLAAAIDNDGWSKSRGLWPFDLSLQMMKDMGLNTLVLVEGQRDALRLIMSGIPAVCIFGTQSWSDKKSRLLEISGVERIILMMDGDDAGIDATDKLKPQLKNFFDVVAIRLWAVKGSPYQLYAHYPEPSKRAKEDGVDLFDPGNCPAWIIDRIKSKYFSCEVQE